MSREDDIIRGYMRKIASKGGKRTTKAQQVARMKNAAKARQAKLEKRNQK